MNFLEKLAKAIKKNSSLVCVGLDPDPELMPRMGVLRFNEAIIDATADVVCAYKLNLAFYEALGTRGTNILKLTVQHIPSHIPVIGDGKRNDIGNTARAYARALFEVLGFDAATVNPYMGFDSVKPFIDYRDKAVFILCRTSNSGAMDFQSLRCAWEGRDRPLYEIVAEKAQEWNTNGNIGLVVGATYPEELKQIRAQHPGMLFLIPGVGAQGGDLQQVVRHGLTEEGEGVIINSSRQILYASRGEDFAAKARLAAQALRDQINYFRVTPE